MALLILTSKQYANLLDKAVPSRMSLKVRRAIEKLRAKKRSARQIQINLEQDDAARLTGFIYDGDFIQRDASPEQLAAQLDAFATENVVAEAPYIVYSISEWKAIVEMATKCDSTLVTTDPEVQNVFYPLCPVFEWVEYSIIDMIRRAHGLPVSSSEGVDYSQEGVNDTAAVGEIAFGAVCETPEENDTTV